MASKEIFNQEERATKNGITISGRGIVISNGSDIAMDGKLADGTPIRWRYEAITATPFHYSAEKMRPDDKSGHLYLELFGKRAA